MTDFTDKSTHIVTIIMPVYNGEKFIRTSVGDIFAQENARIELIAVDDGSSDSSSAILAQLQNEAPQNVEMHIVTQTNQGICAARNAGLERANGEFIAFVDQDDRIPRDYIAKLVEACRDADVAIGGTVEVQSDGGPLSDEAMAKTTRRDLNPEQAWSLYRNNAPWGRIYRRAIIESHNIRFFETKISEDFYFNFVYLSYCATARIITQSGYIWRIDSKSESHAGMSSYAADRDVTVMLDALLRDMGKVDETGAQVLTAELFEYLVVKHCVWYLLFIAKGSSREMVREAYRKVTAWLGERFPEYAKNKQIRLGRPAGESASVRSIVKICVTLNKMKLFLPLLQARRIF